MDSTSTQGLARSTEQDALRLLAVVHHLGDPVEESGVHSVLVGEERLLAYDHLSRHPGTLALLLLDRAARDPHEIPSRLVDGLRDLIAGRDTLDLDLRTLLLPVRWERRDDALAYLGCRALLRVRPWPEEGEPPRLSYWLPDRVAESLDDQIYPAEPALEAIRRRCRLMADYLPTEVEIDLSGTRQRFETFRQEEQLDLEDDLLASFFQSIFGEAL